MSLTQRVNPTGTAPCHSLAKESAAGMGPPACSSTFLIRAACGAASSNQVPLRPALLREGLAGSGPCSPGIKGIAGSEAMIFSDAFSKATLRNHL